jgi:hypothetical protein
MDSGLRSSHFSFFEILFINGIRFGDEIMDRCGKVHDFLVSGQQNHSIYHGGILDRMRDHVLHRRAMAKIRGHLLITSAGLTSLQDAGCRGVFSGGIARWAQPPAIRCHPSGMKNFRVGVFSAKRCKAGPAFSPFVGTKDDSRLSRTPVFSIPPDYVTPQYSVPQEAAI